MKKVSDVQPLARESGGRFGRENVERLPVWGRGAVGARLNGIQEVPGSNPGGSTFFVASLPKGGKKQGCFPLRRQGKGQS